MPDELEQLKQAAREAAHEIAWTLALRLAYALVARLEAAAAKSRATDRPQSDVPHVRAAEAPPGRLQRAR